MKPKFRTKPKAPTHNKITLSTWYNLLEALRDIPVSAAAAAAAAAAGVVPAARAPSGEQLVMGEKAALYLARKYKRACMRLWEGFTGHKNLPRDYLADPEFRLAYLLGFHLINAARMENLLERVSGERGVKFPDMPVDLWDFGCGTGAITTTLLDFLSKKHLRLGDIHLCDASRQLLGLVEKSLHTVLPPTMKPGKVQLYPGPFTLGKVQVNALDRKRVHIFSFGYVLNELDEKSRINLVQWMGKLARSQAPVLILIVDSSDEIVCRALMEFRDEAVEQGLHPVYPCPHSFECPMLPTKDWCYSEARWRLPKIQEKIDEVINHPRRTMTMSSYAFANNHFLSLQESRENQLPVLVGKPLDKFRKELQIPIYCQADGKLVKDLAGAVPRLSNMRGTAVQGLTPAPAPAPSRGRGKPVEENLPVVEKKPWTGKKPWAGKKNAAGKPKPKPKPKPKQRSKK